MSVGQVAPIAGRMRKRRTPEDKAIAAIANQSRRLMRRVRLAT